MAHIGKLWRLQIRRDFNLNLTNYKTGLGVQYLVDNAGLLGVVGAAVNFRAFIVTCPDNHSASPPFWDSGIFVSGGRHIRYTLGAIVEGSPQVTNLIFDIFDSVHGNSTPGSINGSAL